MLASEKIQNKKENLKKLYPNTDFTVFLRSCEEEITKPIDGVKTGVIPGWLNGTLIRNGPGNLKFGDYHLKHLFDGSALLHKFKIKNGTVTYQCRFLRTESYKKNYESKRIIFNEFGTQSVPDPCHSLLKRFTTLFHLDQYVTDTANISIYPFHDEIYSLSETVYAHKINPETLECEKRKDIREFIPMVVHHSSHPHIEDDGTIYNLALSVGAKGPVHHIVSFTKPEQKNKSTFDTARILANVPAVWRLHPAYMHTFGITENYFVLIQQPLSISLVGCVTAYLVNRPTSSALRWFGDEQTIITLIDRKTGKFKNFYTKSFFYLHTINQYEIQDKYLVLDICCYKNPDFVKCMFTDELLNAQNNPCFAQMANNRPQRFVIPLGTITIPEIGEKRNLIDLKNSSAEAYFENGHVNLIPEELCNISCETPQIFYKKYLGKPYRYFYAIGADISIENPGLIIKVDTEKKTCITWHDKNCYPSEPIFFPKPNSQSEDDGVLMSTLVWGEEKTNKVGIIILDALSLTEIGRVEFKTPSPVPKCLHGWFFPDSK